MENADLPEKCFWNRQCAVKTKVSFLDDNAARIQDGKLIMQSADRILPKAMHLAKKIKRYKKHLAKN